MAKITRNPSKNFKTQWLLYRSLVEKRDKKIVYDPRLDEWLDNNLPSVLLREDGIGRICVETILGDDSEDLCDYERLQSGWNKLKESGEAISYLSITKLAKENNVLKGKWILCVPTGYKVDIIWRKIAKGMMSGALANMAIRAKVTPRNSDTDLHFITIRNMDYTDEKSVFELNSALREVGVKCMLSYKPNVYSYLGIYKDESKIRPSIYKSTYDVLKKESTVTRRFL